MVYDSNVDQNIPHFKAKPQKYKKSANHNKGNNPVVGHNELLDDKYHLELLFKKKYREKIAKAQTNATFRAWQAQNDQKFGFVPLNDLVMPERDSFIKCDIDPIKMHEIVNSSGKHNFMGKQLIVNSDLKLPAWEKHLVHYWDQQLLLLLKGGFPLEVNNSNLSSTFENHKSARDFSEHVDHYLKTESEHKAILGPFDSPPIKNLHVSPLLTREKSNSSNRRVIMDLSFPKGHAVNSNVNNTNYLGTEFVLTLPTIDNIVDNILDIGPGALLYKVDIARAFRQLKINPSDYKYLGLCHKGYYCDLSIPFGYVHGSKCMQRCTDSIRYIMSSFYNVKVVNYIDDIVACGNTRQAYFGHSRLVQVLAELGLVVNKDRNVPPSTTMVCLGIEIDTVKLTLAVHPSKLQQIVSECHVWSTRKVCTRRQLQSILGLLLYITKCVKHARFSSIE